MLNRLYNWYGKRVVRIALIVIIVLVILGTVLGGGDNSPAETETQNLKVVKTASLTELTEGTQIELVGTVEAVSEAKVQAEAAGRVTRVNVALGEYIAAGTVLGAIENQSEYAMLLQAEGVYEAALAAAAQSDVGVLDAESSLASAKSQGLNTYKSAYISADGVLTQTVDQMFSNPESGIIGVRLSKIDSGDVNDVRVALRDSMDAWEDSLFTTDSKDVETALAEAAEITSSIEYLVEKLFNAASDSEYDGSVISGIDMEAYRVEVQGARTIVNGILQSIEGALAGIEGATEAFNRIKLTGTNAEVSSANAQVKQALGSLRGAQANFEKTIFRTPISGTVNELNIKVGDFVSSFQRVGVVANNDALLITAYVGDADTKHFAVDTEVLIDGQYTGTVSHVAPAYNPETGKVEIKIETDANELQNGDIVSLSVLLTGTKNITDTTIQLPLTAVKLTAEEAYIFTVDENNILVGHLVTLGRINGAQVEILEGLERDWMIVTDARGLISGLNVEVIE